MNGIAGVMTRNGVRPEAGLLGQLRSSLIRGGSGESETYVSDSTGLVSSRLRIIASQAGGLALSRQHPAALVADTEIYNEQDLRTELEELLTKRETYGEAALHLYRCKALGLGDNLRGGYAIAIYDPAAYRLILSRDAFGIKPLYYCTNLSYFAFVSTPRALIEAGLANTRIGTFARSELLRFKFTSGRSTIFSDIRRVLPGETLVISGGRITERLMRKALPEVEPGKINSEAAVERLSEVLGASLAPHLQAEIPSGFAFFGGMASAVLLQLAARMSSKPLVVYTIRPREGEFRENPGVHLLACSLGLEHHALQITEDDFWLDTPRVAAELDDPTTDAAAFSTYVLGKGIKTAAK